MTIKRLPKVFVVSAKEDGMIRDALQESLSSVAEIVTWNREDLWQPGHSIIEQLLEFPRKYDFAIAIFGPTDIKITREVQEYQPRDNVIFETGMFMSYLGKDRTFIVMPDTPPVKILIDLAGLITCRYDSFTPKAGWMGALKTTCTKITARINRLGLFTGHIAVGPHGFFHGHAHVLQLLKDSERGIKPRIVKNIALDMGMTWHMIKNELIHREEFSGVKWYSVMMDCQSDALKNIANKPVSVTTAANQEKDILACGQELTDAKNQREVFFECKVYKYPPTFHGFLIDGNTLILNVCNLAGGQLQSAENYMIFRNDPENEVATDYIKAFTTWFDYMWENSPRTIWPINET
jgi:hypothetical protein